jgi:hypothetical protein
VGQTWTSGKARLPYESGSGEKHPPPVAKVGLMLEAFGVLTQLRELIQKINAANTSNKLPDGRTLSEAIAQRDELTQQHSLIQHAISSSSREPDRYSMTEIKWVACIDVKKSQKQLDDLSQSIRELNLMIQETNWNTDLG